MFLQISYTILSVGFGPQVIKSPHYPENLPSQVSERVESLQFASRISENCNNEKQVF